MSAQQEILQLLQSFQEGYTLRDLTRVEAFMDLFTTDVEIIGTNGVRPGVDEWYTNRETARELVQGDWESWGDLRLDLPSASIRVSGEVGWIAVSATVAQTIGKESYDSYLGFIKGYLDVPDISAEQKLHYILRGGMNTIFELERGEHFVWPLRLTAVTVRQAGSWKFAQVNFSFPTIYFPDVRVFDQK